MQINVHWCPSTHIHAHQHPPAPTHTHLWPTHAHHSPSIPIHAQCPSMMYLCPEPIQAQVGVHSKGNERNGVCRVCISKSTPSISARLSIKGSWVHAIPFTGFECLSIFWQKMVLDYLNLMEQDAAEFCKQKCFQQKKFWAVGVNNIWTCDQHDKWKCLAYVFI